MTTYALLSSLSGKSLIVWRLASHTVRPASALIGASAGIIAVARRRSATVLGRSYRVGLAYSDGGKRPVPQPRTRGGMIATSASAGLIERLSRRFLAPMPPATISGNRRRRT